jgi:hypothetical protein
MMHQRQALREHQPPVNKQGGVGNTIITKRTLWDAVKNLAAKENAENGKENVGNGIENSSTGLRSRSYQNEVLAISALVKNGASINHSRVLHKAVYKKFDASIIRLLLHLGGDLDCQDEYGQTALHIAATSNSSLVPYLISEGANKHIADLHGKTALDYLVEDWKSSKQMGPRGGGSRQMSPGRGQCQDDRIDGLMKDWKKIGSPRKVGSHGDGGVSRQISPPEGRCKDDHNSDNSLGDDSFTFKNLKGGVQCLPETVLDEEFKPVVGNVFGCGGEMVKDVKSSMKTDSPQKVGPSIEGSRQMGSNEGLCQDDHSTRAVLNNSLEDGSDVDNSLEDGSDVDNSLEDDSDNSLVDGSDDDDDSFQGLPETFLDDEFNPSIMGINFDCWGKFVDDYDIDPSLDYGSDINDSIDDGSVGDDSLVDGSIGHYSLYDGSESGALYSVIHMLTHACSNENDSEFEDEESFQGLRERVKLDDEFKPTSVMGIDFGCCGELSERGPQVSLDDASDNDDDASDWSFHDRSFSSWDDIYKIQFCTKTF